MNRTQIVDFLAAAIKDGRIVTVQLRDGGKRTFRPRIFKNHGPGSLEDGYEILYWSGLICGGVAIDDIVDVANAESDVATQGGVL